MGFGNGSRKTSRQRIVELLEFGDEVPKPAGVSVDLFWENVPDDLDEEEVGIMLRGDCATVFLLGGSGWARLWRA